MQNAALHDIGFLDYEDVWQLQKEIFHRSVQEKLSGIQPEHHLIVCEHPHVYTLGKSSKQTNLLLSEAELKDKSIDVFDIERGGDITYHGPGQLVVYPIFDIEQLQIGVRQFVYNIEQAIINVLAGHGLEAGRIDGRIGIWTGMGTAEERKLAAIGIRCSRHITMHGLALNVNTDLNLFNHIIPCGIQDKGVSSIQKELGREIPMSDVKQEMLRQFTTIFELNFIKQ